jgi:predicted small lipoprotein YifL
MKNRHWLALTLALLFTLTACGSGGSTTPESKWDSAKFDEATWR